VPFPSSDFFSADNNDTGRRCRSWRHRGRPVATNGRRHHGHSTLRHVRKAQEPAQLRRGPRQVLSRLHPSPPRFVLAARLKERPFRGTCTHGQGHWPQQPLPPPPISTRCASSAHRCVAARASWATTTRAAARVALTGSPTHLWRPPSGRPWPCPVPRRFATSSGSFARSTATCSPAGPSPPVSLRASRACLRPRRLCREGEGAVGLRVACTAVATRGRIGVGTAHTIVYHPHVVHRPARHIFAACKTWRVPKLLPLPPLLWALIWSFAPSSSPGSETPQPPPPPPPPPPPQRGDGRLRRGDLQCRGRREATRQRRFWHLRPPRVSGFAVVGAEIGFWFGFGFPCAREMRWATQ
jgi:hypothetical protein